MAKTARRVRNLERRYDNLGEFNVNNYKEINPRGLNAIKRIMNTYKLDYDCKLTDITFPLSTLYKSSTRELYEIDTTGQILKILKFIKDNDLMKKEGSYL